MARQKFPTVTLRPDQDAIIKELAQALYGIRHGNKTRFVREAVDEKIERHKNSQNGSN